jgi:glutamate-1-semialdehyde 2,1-aminomutase
MIVKNAAGQPDFQLRTLVMQEMICRGILFQGILSPCYSHTFEDIDWMLAAFEETCAIFIQALDKGAEHYLTGPAIKPVFRKFN